MHTSRIRDSRVGFPTNGIIHRDDKLCTPNVIIVELSRLPPPPFVPNLEINPDFTLWNIPIINDQDPRCCTRENFLFPGSNAADSYNGHPYILVQKFLERERERIFAANLASLTFTQIYIKYKMEEELCNIYICPRFCPTKNTIRHEESK